MLTTEYVNDFRAFFDAHKDFIQDKFDEASELCNTRRDLDIDFDLYQELIDANTVIVLEIQYNETFVGYCSLNLSPAILAKGKVDAKIDHIALDKDYRDKGHASEVLEEIESVLKEQGIDEVSLTLPVTQAHVDFADKNGYKASTTTFLKLLEN